MYISTLAKQYFCKIEDLDGVWTKKEPVKGKVSQYMATKISQDFTTKYVSNACNQILDYDDG